MEKAYALGQSFEAVKYKSDGQSAGTVLASRQEPRCEAAWMGARMIESTDIDRAGQVGSIPSAQASAEDNNRAVIATARECPEC